MSRFKNWQMFNVERAVRAYPAMREELNELHRMSITANSNGMPSAHGGVNRKTEDIAIRSLAPSEQMWLEAIENAIEETKLRKDGDTVLRIIELVDFKKLYTVEGAGRKLRLHRNTVTNKRMDFFCKVQKKYEEKISFVQSVIKNVRE